MGHRAAVTCVEGSKEMSNEIHFNDKALNEIAQAAVGKLRNFQSNLDRTSADIRCLEKWLQDCGICFYVQIDMGDDCALGWSSEGDSWRLVYSSPENGIDHDEVGDEYPASRPLIEMPVKARLKAKPYLSKLLAEIASLVPDDVVEAGSGKGLLARARLASKSKTAEVEDLDAIFAREDDQPI
jgi:hypothetical protein